MERILSIAQVVLAILLMAAILFQNRGTGLGTILGGEGNVYRTKRGLEKVLFTSTIVISLLFFGVALANILVRQ